MRWLSRRHSAALSWLYIDTPHRQTARRACSSLLLAWRERCTDLIVGTPLSISSDDMMAVMNTIYQTMAFSFRFRCASHLTAIHSFAAKLTALPFWGLRLVFGFSPSSLVSDSPSSRSPILFYPRACYRDPVAIVLPRCLPLLLASESVSCPRHSSRRFTSSHSTHLTSPCVLHLRASLSIAACLSFVHAC